MQSNYTHKFYNKDKVNYEISLKGLSLQNDFDYSNKLYIKAAIMSN